MILHEHDLTLRCRAMAALGNVTRALSPRRQGRPSVPNPEAFQVIKSTQAEVGQALYALVLDVSIVTLINFWICRSARSDQLTPGTYRPT